MKDITQRYHLLMACPDHLGIIHAVCGVLAAMNSNIVAFDQHSEGPDGGYFFMRAEFDAPGDTFSPSQLEAALGELFPSGRFAWQLRANGRVPRLGVLVSKEGHCLEELAWQIGRGDIPAEIAVVISNHPDLAPIAQQFHLPFFRVEVAPHHRKEAEAHLTQILLDHHVDTVILARYMQILTDDFIQHYPQQIINIHHSFLPAFVGAKPYHQAYQRGVKLIGATAHYVTAELDGGPIIEQDVHRVDHRHQVEDYKRIGRTVERLVLARAVTWHVEGRVLLHGNRTIVFPI